MGLAVCGCGLGVPSRIRRQGSVRCQPPQFPVLRLLRSGRELREPSRLLLLPVELQWSSAGELRCCSCSFGEEPFESLVFKSLGTCQFSAGTRIPATRTAAFLWTSSFWAWRAWRASTFLGRTALWTSSFWAWRASTFLGRTALWASLASLDE